MGTKRTGRRPTIHDVAEASGVSTQTVSRVVNEHPSVAAATRDRVRRAIEQLEYTPSAAAKSLQSGRTGTIGVIVGALQHTGPSETLLGITQECANQGLSALVADMSLDGDTDATDVIEMMRQHRVDGIVAAIPMVGGSIEPLVDAVDRSKLPAVFVRAGDLERHDAVTVDNAAAIDRVVDHLVSLGRRRIAHVSGPLNWWEARVRADSWRSRLEHHGLDPADELMVEGTWDADTGAAAAHTLLDRSLGIDAVVAANDRTAFGVLHALRTRGVSIPDDVAVTGFDDIHEARWAYPPLTSVSQPLIEVGRSAVSAVMSIDRSDPEPTVKRLPCELVIRESTIGASGRV